jgi:hypothetical protein
MARPTRSFVRRLRRWWRSRDADEQYLAEAADLAERGVQTRAFIGLAAPNGGSAQPTPLKRRVNQLPDTLPNRYATSPPNRQTG